MEIFGLSKKSLSGLILVAALSSGNSYAAKIVLDFEGIGDLESVSDFYNGGVSLANTTGTDYGVSFTDDAFGIIDSDVDILNFSGNFANEPSGNTTLIFREGGAATMNVADGFKSSFFLFYSSSAPAIVNIYDGLDGTGNLLASLVLETNYNNNCAGDPFGDWCQWDQIGTTFKGTAKSVVFEGPREFTFYDNITLGNETKKECNDNPRHKRGRFNKDIPLCNPVPPQCKDFRKHRRSRHSVWHRFTPFMNPGQ